jgi:leader peptidase (prepilin peptidase)/N-methyltransferase
VLGSRAGAGNDEATVRDRRALDPTGPTPLRPYCVALMSSALVAVLAFVFGAVIGSFLNVVLWRVPRHESIVAPPSHCPECGSRLQARDLIPIVSWIALRGRCRTCDASISIRYPLVEAGTGLAFAAVAVLLT